MNERKSVLLSSFTSINKFDLNYLKLMVNVILYLKQKYMKFCANNILLITFFFFIFGGFAILEFVLQQKLNKINKNEGGNFTPNFF